MSGSRTDKFVLEIQIQAMELQDKLEQCEKGQREVDYSLSRVDFFKRNIPRLAKSMKGFEESVTRKVLEQQSVSEALAFQRDCDVLLDLGDREKGKLKALATREGLKEGERRLFKSLEDGLRDSTCKFADYKNAIRKLS
jgi:hypothetical protein